MYLVQKPSDNVFRTVVFKTVTQPQFTKHGSHEESEFYYCLSAQHETEMYITVVAHVSATLLTSVMPVLLTRKLLPNGCHIFFLPFMVAKITLSRILLKIYA